MTIKALWVGIGGFFGAISRYALGIYVNTITAQAFPYGTLTVNSLGSLLLGLLSSIFIAQKPESSMSLLISAGFLGSFTTFSTFSHESAELLRSGASTTFFLNVASNILICISLAYFGYWIGAKLIS